MDTVSEAASQVSQTSQNLQPISSPLPEEPLEKPVSKIKTIFSRVSWIFFFTFLPVTVLILVSQNTVPGDLFYPIKRSMENVVLAAASVSPVTRVAFRTDLTERRFDEAETLLLARKDTTGLNNFIEDVAEAEQEIASLSNEEAKKDVAEKLIKKIDEYQNKLVVIETKTQKKTTIVLSLPTKTPTPIKTKKDASQIPRSVEKPSALIPAESSPEPTSIRQISTPTPSLTHIKSPDIVAENPSPTIRTETLTPTEILSDNPPQMPTPTPFDIKEDKEEDEVAKAIDDTQKKLDEIKKQLEEHGKGKSSEIRQDEDHRGHEDKNDNERNKEKEKKDREKS